ncbi:bifunctional diguanylate cyclase/phosphodiesterase, partial [bacterium]
MEKKNALASETRWTKTALLKENAELQARLGEMEDTLRAIKSGAVDALFLGNQVFSLQGVETPYRLLVESMNEGAATLALDGTILYCNQRLSTLLDIPLNLLIGSQLRQHVRTSECSSFEELFTQGREGLSKGECVFHTEGGVTRPIQCSFSPLEARGVRTVSLVATDLTDRKLAEQARFASTLSSIGDAVVATDLNGTITFLNTVAENLTGWTLAESLTKPAGEIFTVINEQTRAAAANPIARVLKTGTATRLEEHALLIRKDGGEIPIDDSAAPIFNQGGN